jgi:ABC-type uncharacterized transport system substrate-binding protein
MASYIERRKFLATLGGAAATWPLAARAQQAAMPIVGLVSIRSADGSARNAAAFRKGLNETGTIEGQDVMVAYHWLDGQYDRLPAVMADLVRSRVAVIATPGFSAGAQAAKAATTTIPIVFGVGEDPVRLGLVASLARPGDNATGIHSVSQEVMAKRLGLFHDVVPKASRIAVLVNPANQPIAEAMSRDMPEAARAIGLQVQLLKASTSLEIEAAFATLVRDRADALFVAGDLTSLSRPGGNVTGIFVRQLELASKSDIHAAHGPLTQPPATWPWGKRRGKLPPTYPGGQPWSPSEWSGGSRPSWQPTWLGIAV